VRSSTEVYLNTTMRAVVTGASGFVGSELVRQLRNADVDVVAIIGPPQNGLEIARIRELERKQIPIIRSDLRRENPLESIPNDWDTLFHLAAYVKTEENSPDVRINDIGTARLLKQLSVAGKRVIYTSTIAVADNAPGGLVKRDTVCTPRTEYGATKLAAESIIRGECQLKSGSATIVRLPTIYGAGYRIGGMFDVLPKQLLAKNPLARLAWPGRMALMAVEDCAQMLYRAATNDATVGRTFAASSGENPMTWEIAEAIAASIKSEFRLLNLPKLAISFGRSALGNGWQAAPVPYFLQVAAWRASLLLNGLYCDGDDLRALLGLRCQNWREGFAKMYAEYPRHIEETPVVQAH
jgi:nucleoside-diphosphate-sugar epimerase